MKYSINYIIYILIIIHIIHIIIKHVIRDEYWICNSKWKWQSKQKNHSFQNHFSLIKVHYESKENEFCDELGK